MKLNFRRFLAMFLSIVMVAGMLPAAVFAEDGVETTTYVAKVGNTECADAAALINALNAASGEVTVEIYDKITIAGLGLSNANITKLSFVGASTDAEICVDGKAYIDVRSTSYPIEYTDLILSHINAGQNIDGFLPQYFSTYNGGNVTYTRCSFPNGVTACGSTANTTYTFNQCTFNNITSGLYSLWVCGNSTNVVINGGTFSGVRGIKMYSEGSDDFSTLSVTGATFSNTITEKPAIVLTKGESITLTGNTFENTTGTVQVDGDYASYIEGNTVTIDGTEYTVDSENLQLKEVAPAVTYIAQIGDKKFETLAAAFEAAQDGDEVKILTAGTYALSTSGKDITITGAVGGVVFEGMGAKNMGSASVTFNNVTFNWTNENYKGLQHSGNLVYNNCIINGQVFLYGASETFNDCTFNQNSADAYNVWTYGAKEVKFNGCTFNSAGKSVLVYTESATAFTNLAVANTAFNASAAVDGKAAIEIDTSLSAGANITVGAATTATGFGTGSVSGNSLWNNKKGSEGDNNDITVVVDGVTVLKPVVLSLAGTGTAEDPFLIRNLEELIWFRDKTDELAADGSSQYAGKFIKLTADIDLAGINWEPIGSATDDHGSFYGCFDGDGHTIYNLYVEKEGEGLGFFAKTSGGGDGPRAQVKNLNFHNVTVKSTDNSSYVGGVIGNSGGNTYIENVHLTGTINISGYGYVGGIVGHGYPDIDNCHVNANDGSYIHGHYWCVGGIIGYAGEGGTLITNSSVSGVDIWSAYGAAAAVAGLLQDGNKLEDVSAYNVKITSNSDYCMGYIAGNGECSTMTNITANNVTVTAKGNPITSTDAVASIGDAIYFDLQSALDAVKEGETIVLLSDIVFNASNYVSSGNGYFEGILYLGDQSFTIDLDSHTITCTAEINDYVFNIKNLGAKANEITIKNGTITGGTAVWSVLCVGNSAETHPTTVNLEGVTVNAGTNSQWGDLAVKVRGASVVNLRSGTKIVGQSGTTYVVAAEGNAVLNVYDGAEITACAANAPAVSGNGTVNIYGGTVTATNGAFAVYTYSSGTPVVNISGGTITGDIYAHADVVNYPSAVATVNISGGTINGALVESYYGTPTGECSKISVSGGTFDQDPSTYVASGYKAEENEGIFSVVKSNTIWEVATKAELADAVAKAQAGDTILLTADIDYGTDQLKLEKAITLDLGKHTLTTRATNYGLALKNDGCIVTNGTLDHAGTVAAIKVWDAAEISDLEINVTGTSSSGNTIDGIVIQQNAAGVDIIKNVKIYSTSGQGVDSGIKTYNCGNATEPVIGSMENVTIDAKSVGLNISAPCGTATNCFIKGGTNGIEIWIKGTYSATLNLVGCKVVGGVFAHDEFSSDPSIVNKGTLELTADDATTGVSEDAITLTIARAKNVEGILKKVMANAQAKVNDTYYATLAEAVAAANAVEGGATVELLADVTLGEKLTISGNVTISGAHTITRDAAYTGTLFEVAAGATLTMDDYLTIDGGNAWTYTKTPLEMDMANGAGTYVENHITPAEGGVNATASLIVNKGTLNANKVTIENCYSTNNVSVIDCGASSVTTLDGALMQNIAANRSGAVLYVGGDDAVLTIKGDTRITGNFGIGNGGIIQNYGKGTTVNMEGGSIYHNHIGKSGTLYATYSSSAEKINTFNMSGGIITENIMEGYGPIYIHTNSIWNMTGGEISNNTSFLPSYVRNNNPAGSMTGGKIINNEITGLEYSNGYYATHPDLRLNGKTEITGGTFTQDVTEYLAPDLGMEKNADGTYVPTQYLYEYNGTAYKNLAEVIAAIADTSATPVVKVLASHKPSVTSVINTAMVLDLNGKTIYGVTGVNPIIRVLADVTVTGDGMIDSANYGEGYCFIVGNGEGVSGNLTIENGTFKGTTTAISVTKGTATLLDGDFRVKPYQESYDFLLNCIDANYKDGTAKIVVKGGKFTEFNPAYNAAEGTGTNFVADGYESVANDNGTYTVNKAATPVAQIGTTTYTSLQEAIDAAQPGDTITLLYAEGDAPIAMNGAVYGKTVTITGTATVDWSKGFLFVGRGGEGNGTVIFDNANLTSASNSSSYGIHVSGREKNTTDKYDGTLEIKNSTIELDYLINKGTMTLDNSTLTVKNGFSVGGRPASETESGEDATATLNLTNDSKVIVNNHNGMGLGYEAIGVMNIDATSAFETTQSFLVTAKGTMNVNGGTVNVVGTLTNNGNVNFTNVNLKDITIDGSGTTCFNNTINFYGTNSITSGINGAPFELIVNKGATLLISRFVLGYGRNITVYGEIEDAHDFDPTDKTPSLKFNSTSGVGVGGDNTGNLTVEDAYIELGNSSWKNAQGTYTWSFKNSYVSATSFTDCKAPYTDNASWTVTFDDSVLAAKNYIKNGVRTTYNFINGSVATTGSIRIDGELYIDETSSVTTTSYQNNTVGAQDEHGDITGTVKVDGTLTIGSNSALAVELLGGELHIGSKGKVNLTKCPLTIDADSKVVIDATDKSAGVYDGLDGTVVNNGTIEVINNAKLTAGIDENGNIVLVEVKTYVAQIGEEKFETVAAALAYAKEQGMTDVEITLIGETESNTTDSFDLLYTTLFNSVTIKQEDPTKTYYLYDLYTGVRTNGGKFIFDGVNITVTDQYMFQGNVELINNSKITSTADANCFFYYADVIVNGGSSIKGVIEDIRGGTLTIDGGKTDGTYAETPSLQDAIFIVNWADSNLVLQNGAYVKINAANEVGRLTVNGTLNISDSKLDSYQWIAVNAGATLTVNGNSTITTKEITGTGKIIIDATGMTAGKVDAITANASAFTGTLEVINNDKLTAVIDGNGNIVLVEVKTYVAQIGEMMYETFEDALDAVKDGETITVLNAEGSEKQTEIEFTKGIEFTITGTAPNYALPVVTFQNATVNIENATILIPELDARENATINVIDSTVYDAGDDSIVKSYYNGAINISGTSVVYTMQVTTMGYITVSDTASLTATWQTNVYGNGLITVKDDATFNTAALQLTGKDYSGRDNTDADRVGEPAQITVNGGTLNVGKATASNDADYSYNSSYGINIGTIAGKQAVLDIKNGAKVNIYMADGATANIGADGTVNVDGTLTVGCRAANGTATLVNNGSIVLKTVNSTVTANECGNVTTSVADYEVEYAGGKYTVAKIEEVEPAGTITSTGHSISLEGNIWINKYATFEGFEDIDLTKDAGLLIWTSEISEEDAVYGAEGVIVKEGLLFSKTTADGKAEYGQITDGIVAPKYGDKLYMRFYVNVGDHYEYGAFTAYSVEDYCRNKIEKSSNESLKKLCVAVLNYGAQAQIKFNHNPDDLVNAGIDSGLVTAFSDDMIIALDETFTTQISPSSNVTSNGRSISLDEGITINYYYKASGFTVKTAELLTWSDVEGELTYENAEKTTMIYTGSEYGARGALVPAAECGDTIYACARFTDTEGNVYYSAVTAYSAHQYAANQIAKGKNVDLLKAFIVYSNLANEYFNK